MPAAEPRSTAPPGRLAARVLRDLGIVKGLEHEDAAVALGLAALLFAGRRAFPLGSSALPHPALVFAGLELRLHLRFALRIRRVLTLSSILRRTRGCSSVG